MLGINGSELIILIVIAVIVLGPEKLPEYTRSLTEWIRRARDMAEGAKTQFKEETGTDFDSVDWRKYDPRQYDPRRIIRDALREPAGGASTPARRAGELTGVSAEDLHGGLTRQDIADMDPRTLFRKPAGEGSTAVGAADLPAEPASPDGEPAPGVGDAAASVAPAAVAGGAAAALLGAGRAEALVAAPAAVLVPHPSTEPDPMELLGLAPAPFDVDAT